MTDESQSSNNNPPHPSASNPRQRALPMGSSFNDLFRGGRSVWLKIIGAAVAAPLATVVAGVRASGGGGSPIPTDPATVSAILFGATLVGALVGSALVLKDIVCRRKSEGLHVSFPLRLMFGFGIFSLLFVWVPLGFLLSILCAMSVLLEL